MKPNDEVLWEIAKKRAAFRKQLTSYLLVNCFLWGIWFISGRIHFQYNYFQYNSFPWPGWVMFWWGIALAFSFANAYMVNTNSAIEQEYHKLKNQQ